jgi:uncharacterized Rmd1/YagE family protein
MYKVIATQISDSIDLEKLSAAYNAELLHSDHFELFYETGTEMYVSVFRYGVVCFFNHNDLQTTEFIRFASDYCTFFYDSELIKVYSIETPADELKFGFNKAEITYPDIETMRLIMMNVAQSVALDYYSQKARVLLDETNKYTSYLETTGKLAIANKKLKKFIGQTHNLKNQITENLHVFDILPEITRTSDYLIKVNSDMKSALFLEKRSSNIQNELQIIKEHLEYFNNIMNFGSFLKLEWIIIILLLIFVIDILIGHLL